MVVVDMHQADYDYQYHIDIQYLLEYTTNKCSKSVLAQQVGVVLALMVAGCAQPLPLQTSTASIPSPTQSSRGSAEPVATGSVGITATSIATATIEVQTTALPVPSVVGGTPVVVSVPTVTPLSSEEIWLAQQSDRQEFAEPRRFRAASPAMLLWFDPTTGQRLTIGQLVGEFTATAEFKLKGQADASALAVPYAIDTDYGLTAISPAVRERMLAAGFTERVEAFLLVSDSIVPADAATVPSSIRVSSHSSLLLRSRAQQASVKGTTIE